MPTLEPQVDRKQNEQRDDQHDPEMIGIERQRVGAIDRRAVDRAVDVDAAALVGADRGEHRLVQVAAGAFCDGKLEQPVQTVRDHASDEPPERAPVHRLRALGEVGDGADEEQEVQRELHDPLGKQLAVGERLEVEERHQVDDREEREEEEQYADRPWEAPVGAACARRRVGDEEHRGGDVGDVHVRPAGGPAHLGPGDREDVGEQQGVGDARSVPGPPGRAGRQGDAHRAVSSGALERAGGGKARPETS